MDKPLISIIIPVYNKEQYLSDCLDTVLSQSYKNIEIICIDDGSTDKSSIILKNYCSKDSRMHLYESKHLGVSKARNIGINKAKGEFIHFLDADDLIKPNTYQKIIDFIVSSDKEIDLISFYHDRIYHNQINFKLHKNQNFVLNCGEKQGLILSFSNSPNDFIKNCDGFTVSNKLMKTKIIKKNKILFDKYMFSEDNDFFFSFLRYCNLAIFLPYDFYIYRINEGSLSYKKQNKYDINNLAIKTFNKFKNSYKELGKDVYSVFCESLIGCAFYEYARTSNYELRLKNINEILDFKNEISKNVIFKPIIDKFKDFFNLIEYNRSSLISNNNYESLYINTLDALNKYTKLYNDVLLNYNQLINSKTYKLGSLLSTPYRKLKRIFKTNNKVLNSKNDLISVIVPVYNTGKYLDKCISSICNQTYKNLEIILVNDGSTDNSELICYKYHRIDKRIKYYKTINKGLSSARNFGLNKSHGKYICFIDSDDYIDKEYVAKLHTFIFENKCDVAICGVTNFASNRKFWLTYPSDVRCNRLLNKFEFWNEFYCKRNSKDSDCSMVMATNRIYKRNLIKWYRFKPIIYEDEYASTDIFHKTNKIGIFNVPLYFYYRNRPGSIMYNALKENNKDKRRFDTFKCYLYRNIFFIKKRYPLDLISISSNYWLDCFFGLSESEKKQYRSKILFSIKKLYRYKLISKEVLNKVIGALQ